MLKSRKSNIDEKMLNSMIKDDDISQISVRIPNRIKVEMQNYLFNKYGSKKKDRKSIETWINEKIIEELKSENKGS